MDNYVIKIFYEGFSVFNMVIFGILLRVVSVIYVLMISNNYGN